MSDSIRIGKARLKLVASGCIDCGTEFSSGWEEARKVPVYVGEQNRRRQRTALIVTLHRCVDCVAEIGGEPAHLVDGPSTPNPQRSASAK